MILEDIVGRVLGCRGRAAHDCTVSAPKPDLISVTGIPEIFVKDQHFDVTVTAANNGETSGDSD